MKKIINILLLLGVVLVSCAKIDNYEEPKETFTGMLIDKGTGEPFHCCPTGGTKLKLMEYSWDEKPTPYYIVCKVDGSFNHTKLFKGEYGVQPVGAFVPYQQLDAEGNYIRNDEVRLKIEGTVEYTFEVEPFLRLEWVGEPSIDEKGRLVGKVIITRGTDNPDYQANINYIAMYVSSTPSAGNGNYIANFSQYRSYEDTDGNAYIGEELQYTSKTALYTGRTYYIRWAARTTTIINGVQHFNYSDVKAIEVPAASETSEE